MKNKKLTTSVVASLLLATNLYSNDSQKNLFSQELSSITVTSATKSEQSIQDVTSNVEVITKEELEEKHFTTVSEALSSLAGITFVRTGGLGNTESLLLRGFGSAYTVVLIDGVKYTDPTNSSGAHIQHLLVNDIEKIEVVKGAQSGIWGANAAAGVINIITKKSSNGLNINTNLEYGSFNTKKVLASASYARDNYYVNLSASSLTSDGHTSQAPYGEDINKYEDDDYENKSMYLKFGYKFDENNEIDLAYNRTESETSYDGCANLSWVPPFPPFSGYYSCTDTKEDKSNATTYFSDNTTDFISANFRNYNKIGTVDLYANKTTFKRTLNNIQNLSGGGPADGLDTTILKYDGEVDTFGSKLKIPYRNNKSFILIGAEQEKSTHKNEIEREIKNDALFVTNSINVDDFILTQSLRFDDSNAFDDKLTGKLGIKYNISSDSYISSNYGTSYKTPTMSLMYANEYWANPNLKPEDIKSFDITYSYKGFKTTLFRNTIENLIEFEASKMNNVNGESVLKGLELSYSKEILDDTLLNFSYTYLKAEDADKERLIRRPKQKAYLGIDYYGLKNIHLNLNANYVGSVSDRDYDTYPYPEYETGKYTILNAVVNYNINKNLSTYLKVNNISNRYYQSSYGYAADPRTFLVGLKASF